MSTYNKLAGAFVLLMMVVSTFLLMGEASAQDASPAGTTTAPTATDNQNVFAYDLYSRLAAKEGNVFCSPFSVEQALYMTWFATSGDTAKQIASTLCLPNEGDEVAKTIASLCKQVAVGASPKDLPIRYELSVANGLWYQTGMKTKSDFLSRIGKDFSGQIKELDFAAKPDDGRKEINSWIAEKTNDKIKNILPDSSITPQTRAVLANAVYFYSNWSQKFEKTATQGKPFYLSADKPETVGMMHQQGRFNYAQTDQMQLLELPYADGKRSMLIVLPTEKDGLAKVEKTLNKTLPAAIKSLKQEQIKVQLPKFKFESAFQLNDTMKAMGITDLFIPERADFSNMVDANGLYVTKVFHKAFISVDEEGTEAAAATALIAECTARPPSESKEFIADHPFVFVIRDKSGTILFMGRVADPRVETEMPGGTVQPGGVGAKPAAPDESK